MERGRILMPRFHRPFVWSRENRLALLDSILEGIPIGAVTLWETDRANVAAMDRFGPFWLPKPDASAPVRKYVLDGEQRLATLYFALIGGTPSEPDDESPDDFAVFYDLRSRMFVTGAALRVVEPHHLPLTDIFHGARLIRFQRTLMAHGGAPDADARQMIGLAETVYIAFREYQIPVTTVRPNDEAMVTHVFARINAHAIPLNEVHLLNALTWSPRFDLMDRFQQMKEGSLAERGWGDVDDQLILRVCKMTLGMSAYDDSGGVATAIQENPLILDGVERCIGEVARFLEEHCGVQAPDLVPYSAQVVFLAGVFCHVERMSSGGEQRLRDWFWLTTYTEALSGQPRGARFFQILDDVRALASGQMLDLPLDKLPTRRRLRRFDFRSPRSRGLALLLAEEGPRDPNHPTLASNSADSSRLLAEYQTRAMAHLVTSTMSNASSISSSPGARVLVRPESIGPMRKLLQAAEPPPEFLASHIISDNAWQAFKRGDYATFVKLREDELNRMEDKRFQAILRRLYPALGT